VRQMDIHMAEPLMPEPSLVKVEIAVGKLKSYKSSVLIRWSSSLGGWAWGRQPLTVKIFIVMKCFKVPWIWTDSLE
jgi:hypothetical protein